MRRIELYSLFSLCALCVSAVGSSPELTTIMPRGGQRGTEVVVEFTGDRLADAVEIMAHEPGITVAKIEPAPKSVKATLQIAADCPLGEHALRVRTETGISPLRTFWVGALPCIDEKEPNNDFAKPQKIPLNCTVHGAITNEDVDHFAVEMKKGQRLTIEVEAMRLGGTFFDAQVSVLDAQRHELVKFDDSPLTANDPCGSTIIPYDGTYIVRIREAVWAAGDQYRLHIGTMPRPTAVFPAGGPTARKLDVTYLGDALGKVKRKIDVPAKLPDEPYSLWYEDDDGVSPSPLPFRVSDFPNVIEREPNDTALGAGLGVVPCAFNGIIEKPRDKDLFKFNAKKGTTYAVHVYARQLGSPLDSYAWLATSDGKIVAQNDDFDNAQDSYFEFTAPEDRQYILGIRDQLDRGGPLFVYRVEVTPMRCHVEMSLVRFGEPPSQERLSVAVPQGNRMAALIVTKRTWYNGPINFGFADVPRGLQIRAEQLPGFQGLEPVVFEADDDAPLAGALSNIMGAPVDFPSPVASQFQQPVYLTILINQNIYAYRSHRIPIAVTNPVPFRLQIVEPKAPLARGGSTHLKVTAERTGDFKGPIRLQPLYNPPGISAPGEIVLPEGQTEALLPLTANANTPPGKAKYVIIGTADVGGPARASTQLATIDVVQPFVQVALERMNVEQGKQADLVGKVTIASRFPGIAKVKLMGLPPKLSAPEVEITAESKEIRFAVAADGACPPGPVRNLFCQVTLLQEGEPIVFSTGTVELRVNAPQKVKSAAK